MNSLTKARLDVLPLLQMAPLLKPYHLSYTNYWSEHSSAEVKGAAVTYYIPTGRRHDEGDTVVCSKFRLQIKTGPNHCNLVLFCVVVVEI